MRARVASNHVAPPSCVTIATAADALAWPNAAPLRHSVSDGCYSYAARRRDATQFLLTRSTPNIPFVIVFLSTPFLGKPTVTTTLQWTAGFAGSLSAELLCVAHSATPSSTRWVRDDGTWLLHGESVHLFTAGNHYTAKFKEVSERDFGNYTCESKNKFGVTMDTVELSSESGAVLIYGEVHSEPSRGIANIFTTNRAPSSRNAVNFSFSEVVAYVFSQEQYMLFSSHRWVTEAIRCASKKSCSSKGLCCVL